MTASPKWIAGYFRAPPVAIGAAPVWIASYGSAKGAATEIKIAQKGSAGATPIWIAGYASAPPAAIGATAIWISR